MRELDVGHHPLIYHGTYLKCWPDIKEQGLSKMNRQHVHFTDSTPNNTNNRASKIRPNCNIVIEVDADKLHKGKEKEGKILCSLYSDYLACHIYF